MKKLILLALTALTLMACADNGVSAPGVDEPSNNNNNGNCVDIIVGYDDVIDGGAYTDYAAEWKKAACDTWDNGYCVGVNTAAKVPVKYCY